MSGEDEMLPDFVAGLCPVCKNTGRVALMPCFCKAGRKLVEEAKKKQEEEERMKMQEILGKRALVKMRGHSGFHAHDQVVECLFLEASPSGKWTKLRNIYGQQFWKLTDEIDVVEVLKQIERPAKESHPD